MSLSAFVLFFWFFIYLINNSLAYTIAFALVQYCVSYHGWPEYCCRCIYSQMGYLITVSFSLAIYHSNGFKCYNICYFAWIIKIIVSTWKEVLPDLIEWKWNETKVKTHGVLWTIQHSNSNNYRRNVIDERLHVLRSSVLGSVYIVDISVHFNGQCDCFVSNSSSMYVVFYRSSSMC